MHADVVALNFIKLVGDCGYSGHYATAISKYVQRVIEGIRASVQNISVSLKSCIHFFVVCCRFVVSRKGLISEV